MSRRERGTVKLPRGVHRVVARGREYFYYQPGRGTASARKRIVLPNDPTSPEFWATIQKAQGPASTPVVTTVNAILDSYLASPQLEELAEGTRRQYRNRIKTVR